MDYREIANDILRGCIQGPGWYLILDQDEDEDADDSSFIDGIYYDVLNGIECGDGWQLSC